MLFSKHLLLLLKVTILCMPYFPVYGQEKWHISEVEPAGDTISIRYELEADKPGLLFKITPYYVNSKGQRNKMEAITGDVGENVTTGKDKLIIWAVGKQLEAYDDSMYIELDSEVMPRQIAISLARDTYKRTGKLPLTSDTVRAVRYELVDNYGGKYLEGNLKESGKPWEVRLPPTLPLTRQYQLRLWNAQRKAVYTSLFAVKRRIPLSARITAAGLMAGVALYLILKPPSQLPAPFALPVSVR